MRIPGILLVLLAPSLLQAQATVRSDARLLSAPSGRLLATFRDSAAVQTGATRSGATLVTMQGYVHRSLIGAARDSFRISVNASSGALLRATPAANGRVIAHLQNGMGLHEVSRRGEWVQVRRSAWVATGSVQRAQQAARPQQAPQRAAATPVTTRERAERARPPAPAAATDSAPGALESESTPAPALLSEDMTPTRRTAISAAPGGATLGAVEGGTRVVPLARERGWVRVRMEGWIPEEALTVADTTLRNSPSAADLRADPEAARGRAVRWEVQVLAFQTADMLRKDMAPDEPYLLARGPAGESSLMYLALPAQLVTTGRGVPALSTIVVTGRVRVARSQPAGVPIIDVQSLTRR